jgi:hypothetical protein
VERQYGQISDLADTEYADDKTKLCLCYSTSDERIVYYSMLKASRSTSKVTFRWH